jgi:acyl-coenzyme A synthetase/AMP-(fatty) acid ligase
MKSCIDSGIHWPAIDFVISATAPLDSALAMRAENVFNCPVMEIYGCTEAGSLASRRTTADNNWLLFDGMSLKQSSEGTFVTGPNLPEHVMLQDIIEQTSDNEFRLHGRNSDMVNIAGKRASLADLNIRLCSISGVQDAVFVAPGNTCFTTEKLVALVVAPTLNATEIRSQLALKTDPVFLPRYIYFVDKLPRNETGKLPHSDLLDMIGRIRKAVCPS